MLRPLTLLLAALALLALPPTALSQSAGDEQYADPFGEVEEPSGSPEPQGGTEDGSAPAAPAPAAPPTPATPAETVADDSAVSDIEATSAQLPRTGLPVAFLATLGAVMLLAGVTIRRGAARAGPRS
jgi:hypothetical protein